MADKILFDADDRVTPAINSLRNNLKALKRDMGEAKKYGEVLKKGLAGADSFSGGALAGGLLGSFNASSIIQPVAGALVGGLAARAAEAPFENLTSGRRRERRSFNPKNSKYTVGLAGKEFRSPNKAYNRQQMLPGIIKSPISGFSGPWASRWAKRSGGWNSKSSRELFNKLGTATRNVAFTQNTKNFKPLRSKREDTSFFGMFGNPKVTDLFERPSQRFIPKNRKGETMKGLLNVANYSKRISTSQRLGMRSGANGMNIAPILSRAGGMARGLGSVAGGLIRGGLVGAAVMGSVALAEEIGTNIYDKVINPKFMPQMKGTERIVRKNGRLTINGRDSLQEFRENIDTPRGVTRNFVQSLIDTRRERLFTEQLSEEQARQQKEFRQAFFALARD